MQSINKRGTMTKRDEYIIRNRAMADAFFSASCQVDHHATARGGNARQDFRRTSKQAHERADWASKLTSKQFNAEPHKP